MPDVMQPQRHAPFPRMQFRTNANLTNATISGAASTILSPNPLLQTVMELPFGLRVMDFVSTNESDLLIQLTDNFQRRWYGTSDLYVPLTQMSQYPGSGVPGPWRYSRVIDDPRLEWGGILDDRASGPASTLLRVAIAKTIGANRELSLAAACIGNWFNDNFKYPNYLTATGEAGDAYWEMVHAIAVEHFAPYNIVLGPTAGVTSTVVSLDAPGDLFLYGLYYTGGANITIDVNRAGHNTSAGLTTQPLRVDMLGAINNGPRGWHWPGTFFVQMGDQLQITVNSLQPLVDVTESLTFLGRRVDPYDMKRYASWKQWPNDYFKSAVGNTR